MKEITEQLNELLEQVEQTDGITKASVDISVELSVTRNQKLVEDGWQNHYERVVSEDDVADLVSDEWIYFSDYDLPNDYNIIDRVSKRERINFEEE